jgi:signal transduction histidine kinase
MATERNAETHPERQTFRLCMLGLAALLAPATLLYQSTRGQVTDATIIGIVAALMFVLVVLRLAGIVRQQESTNRQLDESIQKLNRADTELRHAQKLRSIGQLASGLAHELNTPMQFLNSNIAFLRDAFTQLDELVERPERSSADIEELDFLRNEVPRAITDSLGGVARVSTIVAAMKAFGNPESANRRPCDLNELISNVSIITEGEYESIATLETQFGTLPDVMCIPADISQVILQLVVNAARAIADKNETEKGKISISTQVVGTNAFVTVSDTGTGIPAEIRDQIFDPFFTTREVGAGTGQGLSLCWTLVTDRHKGSIRFDTEIGVGTTFVISLPVEGHADLHQVSATDRFGASTEQKAAVTQTIL